MLQNTLFWWKRQLGDGIHVTRQAAFEVRCLVAVNVAFFRQTVDHTDNLGQERLGLSLVFQVAQVLDRCTCGLFVITILQATLFVLTDAFER